MFMHSNFQILQSQALMVFICMHWTVFNTSCNVEVETEYHFLFICSYYHSLRNQYLPTYFFNYPSEMKFKHLMDLNDVQLKTNLCKYIIEALKLRAELLTRVRI